MEEKLKKIILSGVIGDTINYEKYVNDLGRNVEYKGQWSYVTEIMIITIKSIIPSMKEVGSKIDYKRFYEELRLWDYYKHGDNDLICASYKSDKSSSYFNGIDNSISSRVFPIVAANVNWEIARREILKNMLYSTGNIKTILENLALSKLIFEILKSKEIDYAMVLEGIKEEIINFSQIDFMNDHGEDFKENIKNYNGIFKIDFEKERINLLNLLNGIYKKGSFDNLYETLNLLKNGDISLENKDYDFILWGINGLLKDDDDSYDIKDQSFIESLSSYIYKIRKGRIAPESLKLTNYNLPDIFSFETNEEFSHSLLNRGKVLSKEDKGKFIISYIATKSGVYRFFKLK